MAIGQYLERARDALGLQRASDELVREQFRWLSRQIPVLYAIMFVNSLFMAFAVLEGAGPVMAFAFPAFTAPIMLGRLLLWRHRAASLEGRSVAQMRKALRGIIFAAAGVAILLGSWAVMIMWSVPAQYYAFIPLFTILSTITCAYCLMALPAATYAVILTGSFYITLAMSLTGDVMMMGMAANMLLVALLVIYMVANQFAQMSRIVASRSLMLEQRAYANRLAHHDQLTNMPNRRAFMDALNRIRTQRPEKPVAVAMIDMNGFKPINDTYGHAAGDRLLINAGQCLTAVVGKDGIVARLGGDEFAVLFPRPQGPEWVKAKVQHMLRELGKPINLGEHEIRLGAAFGIAMKTEMPDDPMEMMVHADIALYEAKNSKSSAMSVFEGNMEERVRRRTMIEQALSDDMQMAGITLNFQPIFALKTGDHVGFEALARWEHPVLGTIAASDFVTAAERSGLATKLTVHLFREALKTARQWPGNSRLSFNLSGSGLGTSNLDTILPAMLSEMQFDPSRLCVEVTETALLSNPEVAQRVLGKLQAIGVRIALDDFGAGYASIGYLQQMRFDDIKLDGSLISQIVYDARARDLLIGVLHLCKAVNADVTAEMVENVEQLTLLKALPIENVQGYLLGRPVPDFDTMEPDPSNAAVRKHLFMR
ncbi:putative bifunctional diguanylate cyclase/phosphodiesterase [Sphingorhabdus arenilitoris]|uniref:Bifunctional diguanylate cyclase/phosphodiesterase n=1 Tax=Sphingorhabdus arenilitoris TaxID=1490041 RepID=A0ABV8RJ19_9SPHN